MMNILIVEDQWLLSSAVEEAVLSLGHEAIGTATTAKEAYELADKAEVVFVDVNLIDGATGPEIGRRLAADGVTVVFMTGNPEQLGSGVGGALGVISKPVMDLELVETIRSNTQRIIMPGETALLPALYCVSLIVPGKTLLFVEVVSCDARQLVELLSAAWLFISGENNRVEGGPRYFFLRRSRVFLSDRVYEILRSHSPESEFSNHPRNIFNIWCQFSIVSHGVV